MREYFYSLLRRYISLFIFPQNKVIEIDPMSCLLVGAIPQGKVAFRYSEAVKTSTIKFENDAVVPFDSIQEIRPDYIVIHGLIHYERDIQALLADLHRMCHQDTRLLLVYYSSLWRPLMALASRVGLRDKLPEPNWLAHEDIENLLKLERFERVWLDHKVLIPFYLPLLSYVINRYFAPLPLFRNFCLVNICVARPLPNEIFQALPNPSVSIIVPARNESENIENILKRIPRMGPDDEIIFIEGHSTDNTWAAIQAAQARYGSRRRILAAQQNGIGKGDAVFFGLSLARNDILMIFDADLTVSPEELPKFYDAIRTGKGEFINGSRLVYPMEAKAMRFFNLLGNKFFSVCFSFVLGQRLKDTLCGTKVISRSNYKKLSDNRNYFGSFDPFGDFQLIFGAVRMGLKIVEIPVFYRERVYGQTNIARWRHGFILLFMLIFASLRLKFL